MPRHLNDVESKLFVKVEDSKHRGYERCERWLVGCFVICMLLGQVCFVVGFFLCQHQNDVES